VRSLVNELGVPEKATFDYLLDFLAYVQSFQVRW
jgi:hypothetical protein